MKKELVLNTVAEVEERIAEILKADEELLIEVVNDIDCYYGYFEDVRCYYMEELDDLLYGKRPLEIIDMIDADFDTNAEFCRFTLWGVESVYRYEYIEELQTVYIDEVVEQLLENSDEVYCMTEELKELVAQWEELNDK